MGNTGTDELETPPWLFEQLDDVFNFELDACASDENALCPKYFTEEDSCLAHAWVTPTWLNPPYSNPGPFLAKAITEVARGITTVALIKGDPSTKWWNLYVRDVATIKWIPRRLKHYLHDKPTPHTASFPSVLAIYWGISWRPDALE